MKRQATLAVVELSELQEPQRYKIQQQENPRD